MRAVDVIRRKRDGHVLSEAEIAAFVDATTKGTWEKYQVSAMLMAIYFKGMNDMETAQLTARMVQSGAKLDWSALPGPKVDKHSTGGVGDKTSLILAPLAAACGCVVPMMSGRGLGHTGGTLDKLESIPGFRVGLSIDETRQALQATGMALISQTAQIAPADKVLYALRDVTSTVESIPLIAGSIMSKKLAEGIQGLVMDVKCGKGAFMKELPQARRLAETIVAIGRQNGVRTIAMITSMEEPLGRTIGNSLEVIECLETLKGRGPADLETLSVRLAAGMVWLGGLATTAAEAEAKVRDALASGRGLAKFRQSIAQQGGNPAVTDDYRLLPVAPKKMMLNAERQGYVIRLDAEQLGIGSMILGAGRERAEDSVDHAVGLKLHVKRGELVSAGDPLVEVFYRDDASLQRSLPLLREAIGLGDFPLAIPPLILETIE
jgi:pyrimidine-nucleoside phosphorylase